MSRQKLRRRRGEVFGSWEEGGLKGQEGGLRLEGTFGGGGSWREGGWGRDVGPRN
jgi:hypothetical protein